MRTAPVKAIVLPAVCRANLEFQLHMPFQNSHTRIIDLRTHGRRGFCTLVHSYFIVYSYLIHILTYKKYLQYFISWCCNLKTIVISLTGHFPSGNLSSTKH